LGPFKKRVIRAEIDAVVDHGSLALSSRSIAAGSGFLGGFETLLLTACRFRNRSVMNRRWIFRMLTGAAAMVPLAGRRAAAEGEGKTHRLVLHVGENDAGAMKGALGNARNAYDFYEQRGEVIAIEIVANGPGLHMFRDDTSPVKQEIRDLRAKVPEVVFAACEHTRDAMEKREGNPVPMISKVTMVPSGVVRLLQLQNDGYAYVKP
jgi:uncharacterized protein